MDIFNLCVYLFVCVYVGILVFCCLWLFINYWTLAVGLSRHKTLNYTHLSLCCKEETKVWKNLLASRHEEQTNCVEDKIWKKHIVMKMWFDEGINLKKHKEEQQLTK